MARWQGCPSRSQTSSTVCRCPRACGSGHPELLATAHNSRVWPSATPVRAGTRLPAVDSVWEQWDLACADPGGCDPIDQLLRAIAWSYVVVALVIFFAALRPWTTDLPRPLGVLAAALGSALVVRISVGIVGSSGSLRTAGIITAVGLAAVWIGRPAFTELGRGSVDVTEDETSTSSMR